MCVTAPSEQSLQVTQDITASGMSLTSEQYPARGRHASMFIKWMNDWQLPFRAKTTRSTSHGIGCLGSLLQFIILLQFIVKYQWDSNLLKILYRMFFFICISPPPRIQRFPRKMQEKGFLWFTDFWNKTLKLSKILLILVESIWMELVAKKSQEGWDSEGQRWKIRNDYQEQRCVIRDPG